MLKFPLSYKSNFLWSRIIWILIHSTWLQCSEFNKLLLRFQSSLKVSRWPLWHLILVAKSSLLLFPHSNGNFWGPWPKTPQSLQKKKKRLYTPNTTNIITLCLIECFFSTLFFTLCIQLCKTYILWSLELFNGRLGLTYHEVIRGRPLFGLPPHTEKKIQASTYPATIKTDISIVQEMFLF